MKQEKSEAPQMRKGTFIKCLVNHRDHPQSGVGCGFLGGLVNKLIRLTFIKALDNVWSADLDSLRHLLIPLSSVLHNMISRKYEVNSFTSA